MPALIITSSVASSGNPSPGKNPSPSSQFCSSFHETPSPAPVQVNVAALKVLKKIKLESKEKNKTLNFIRGKYTTFKEK